MTYLDFRDPRINARLNEDGPRTALTVESLDITSLTGHAVKDRIRFHRSIKVILGESPVHREVAI